MATVSFDDKGLVVRSKKKSQEIIDNIRSGKRAYTDIKPFETTSTKEEEEFVKKFLAHKV